FRSGRRAGPGARAALDPEAPPLERIRGQRHPAPALATVERPPVDIDPGDPETAKGSEQGSCLRLVPLQRSDHQMLVRPKLRAPRDKPNEARPRTDLEEPPAIGCEETVRARAEAHGLPQVPGPVGRVRRIAIRNPITGHVGEKPQAGRS